MTSFSYRGRTVLTDEVLTDGLVAGADGRIDYAGPAAAAPAAYRAAAENVDGYLLPGLVDLHCHGGGGSSFPDATTMAQVRTAVGEHRSHGTTTLIASTVTASAQTLRERTALLREACEAGLLDGIHWEGPFISCERCGAQDPSLIAAPDPELTAELCEIAGPYAVTMTLAPEKDRVAGDGGVADVLIVAGALPSFGHTDSGPAEVEAAVADAARRLAAAPHPRSRRATATHLFNGMRPIHHRDPGPVPALLAAARAGNLVAEVIADGVHLDPAIVRNVYEILGRDQLIFVTDAMAAAGMADGTYRLGSMDVTVDGGVARLTGRDSIAGGTSHLIDQVRLMAGNGIGLVDAVYMAATSPAAVLGRTDVGALRPGMRADILITDPGLVPVRVLRAGAAQ